MDLTTNSASTKDWVRVTQNLTISAGDLGQHTDSVDAQFTKTVLAVPMRDSQLPLSSQE
jgi:hypothetical protein